MHPHLHYRQIYEQWRDNTDESTSKKLARALTIIQLSFVTGFILGGLQGARRASLQFLAEHHHNPPQTRRAVLSYLKQRNSRMMLGAGREGVKMGGRLVGVATVFITGRLAVSKLAGPDNYFEEIVAGTLAGSLLALVGGRKQFYYHLRKGILLGGGFGVLLSSIRLMIDQLSDAK